MAIVGSSEYMWRILRLPMEFFSQRMAGDILQRQGTNASIAATLVNTLTPLLLNTLMMLVYLIVMLRYSVILTAIGIVTIVLNLLVSQYISAKRVNISRVQMRDAGKLAAATVSGIQMVETIKASGAENGYFQKWAGYQASVNAQNVRFARLNQILGIIPAALSAIADALVLILGVLLAMRGEFTLGMILLFQGFLNSFMEGKRRPLWVLAGINAAIYLSAFLSPVSFWIDEYNCYHAGPAAPSCLLVSLFLLADLFRNTVKNRRIIRKRGLWIPSFVLLMILFSIYLDYNIKEGQVSISCLTIAITVGSVFYYIWLHQQFVQKHEQDMMAAQRIRIMMSQIQPHFLYNTIATFKALAGKNPEKAEEVAEKFSVYLRQNLDSLSIDGCIPFEKELEHTRTYAEIEMVRFENVRVEFDLQDLDFGVPPLSLQPLVENAIRHGVRIREEGIVRVSTRRTADGHEIVVADNGEGFDTRVIEEAAGKHIGIRNVRERIETMCGGTLQIDSKCGEGTTVTIRIPAKEAAA